MLFKLGEQAILMTPLPWGKAGNVYNGTIVTVVDVGPFKRFEQVPSQPDLCFMRDCDYGILTHDQKHGGASEKELIKIEGYQETQEEDIEKPVTCES